jgi:phosphoglycolate phosphatase-like HAD superfamily hydrolase
MIKYVGFDKDGTLIDDFGGYTKEWGRLLNLDYGVDSSEAEKIFMEMAGEATALQLGAVLQRNNIILPQQQLFQKAEEIAYLLGINFKGKLFSEVLNFFRILKGEGYKTFVSSGQQEIITRDDLERTGLMQYIDYFVGIRPEQPDFKKGEPHFRDVAKHFRISFESFVNQAVYIGDTLVDVKVAKAVNMLSIARLGTIPEEKLLRSGAKMAVSNFSILPEILKTL